MAKRKNYVNEYRRARENFMRRRREWIKKYHFLADIPEIPKSPTAKDVKRLEKMRLKNMTEKQFKEMEKRFDIAYEEGSSEVFVQPKNRFISAYTEAEYNQSVTAYEEQNYTFETEPEESDDAVLADLHYLLDGLIEHGKESSWISDHSELTDRESIIRSIFENSIARIGSLKSFLRYLESPSTHSALIRVVDAVFSESKEWKRNAAINEFATILNLGRPLDIEQSYELESEGTIGFDYSDTEYE